MRATASLVVCQHQLTGRVQGVGVRPAVARLAKRLRLRGFVSNTQHGVTIEVIGTASQLDQFAQALPDALPPEASVTRWQVTPRSEPFAAQLARDKFEISAAPRDEVLATPLPTDRSICAECLTEVAGSSTTSATTDNHRRGYWLNSCVRCGPRFSLITQMPFARASTAMATFAWCDRCRQNFHDDSNRRFHAETIGCAQCGPRVWLADQTGNALARNAEALCVAASEIAAGRIVGLRGVGGYQLLCDATCEASVVRLRASKGRPAKPLAVLAEDLPQALQLADLSPREQQALTDASNPIVVVTSRVDHGLAPSVTHGLATLGILLPTTAAHAFLVSQVGSPLVCTSANREGEPIAYQKLAPDSDTAKLADFWLHHDREIVHPLDDSVVRVIGDQVLTLRLGRGLAPLELDVACDVPTLALGGQLKGALAWHNGSQAALGPHLGDLHHVLVRERYHGHRAAMETLYGFQPARVVHDLHPDYFTTRLAASLGVPTIAVQHHEAHVAAVMLEHRLLERTVLGVAWDGTGWGGEQTSSCSKVTSSCSEVTIWGGEFLRVSLRRTSERVGRLRPFPLPGGEAAVRDPWRMAATLLWKTFGDGPWIERLAQAWPSYPLNGLVRWLGGQHAPLMTTSAGRLFDAAAALILDVTENLYEGQAAIALESAAARCPIDDPGYPLPLVDEVDRIGLDWRPTIAAIWQDRADAIDPDRMAQRFHRGLAAAIAAMVRRFEDHPVVLCGGVFQNQVLTSWVIQEIGSATEVYLPGKIPCGDGGLAAGQLAASARLACK